LIFRDGGGFQGEGCIALIGFVFYFLNYEFISMDREGSGGWYMDTDMSEALVRRRLAGGTTWGSLYIGDWCVGAMA
jgi:hypothetical protein